MGVSFLMSSVFMFGNIEPVPLPPSIGSLFIPNRSTPGSVLMFSSFTPVVVDVGLEDCISMLLFMLFKLPVAGCFGKFSFGNLVANPAATFAEREI